MNKYSQQQLENAFMEALNGNLDLLSDLSESTNFDNRFNVYVTSIYATLQQTLYKTFKPVELLIGIEAFQELCYRYIKDNLSQHYNLNVYGQNFHTFAATSPYVKDLPYLEDFIEFCYLWQQIFLNPYSDVIQVESEFPLYEIWIRCQPEFNGSKNIINWEGPFIYTMEHDCGKVSVLPSNLIIT